MRDKAIEPEILKDIERYSADGGFDRINVWRTEDGWHYSGPTGAGPKEVRKSGRGPSWIGPVDASHAAELLRRLRERGDRVDVTPRTVNSVSTSS